MADRIKIDYANWKRRERFEFFSAVSQPFYSVSFNADVTGLYNYTHERGISFYYALCWAVTKAVNSVENMLYFIEGGEIYRFSELQCSFTDMKKGSEDFYIVTLPCRGTVDEFCAEAKAKSMAQTEFINLDSEGKDLIFISCLPWLEMTGTINERNFDRDDNIPRIVWGKYRDENGKKTLNISVELNHRFCDGIHIAKFARELERLIEV